jgi:hypothetical protein
MTAAAANAVIERALALPKAKKRILLGRLWQNLNDGHIPPPTAEEIERRAESARKGTAFTHGAASVREAVERIIRTGQAPGGRANKGDRKHPSSKQQR